VGSLSPLVGGLGWPPLIGQPEDNYVFRVVADGESYTSWGLTYVGQAGHVLRLAELAGVLIATVLSVLPQSGPRRVGLVALVAWAGLWLGNALWMVIIAPIQILVLVALFMLVFFVATAARARLAWTRDHGRVPA
jgi:hypothetical protein